MTSGDTQSLPQHMTYSKSRVPIVGALIDYIDTSLEYLRRKTFARAETSMPRHRERPCRLPSWRRCLIMGLTCNVKFEVVKFDEEPLPNDLHFMLMSKDDKLYIDDIDVSRIMWCLEASDTLVVLISCLLIWNSSNVVQLLPSVVGKRILSFLPRTQLGDYARVNKYWAYLVDEFRAELAARQKINNDLDKLQRSPLSEYLFLPWLGATLRGLFMRQAPTAGALFLTAFSFLFLLEARLWLEIARLVRTRWERRDHINTARDAEYEVETLWSNDDVQSIEMRNYVY